jgi:hypothetical protein
MPRLRRPAVATTSLLATAAVACAGLPLTVAPASGDVVAEPVTTSARGAAISLTPLSSYSTGIFDESAAEIVAHHPGSERLFVVNASERVVDVLGFADATNPRKRFSIAPAGLTDARGDVIPEGSVPNSVTVRKDGLGVIALENATKTDRGWLVFFDAEKRRGLLGAVRVGALPDMVTISRDGKYAVVANEGEPNEDYTVDPEGSVGIVSLPRAVRAPRQGAVRTADLHEFEEGGSKQLDEDVRIFAGLEDAENPVSANLEPEYVAVDRRSRTAYVVLQEANATAVVDLRGAEVTDIWPLGFKDHGAKGNGLDPSDRDDEIDIERVAGLKGIYMPDGINAYVTRGKEYLVTANEGDAREWGDYVESVRVADLGQDGLAPICDDSPLADRTDDADLGRLNVSIASGLSAEDCYEELYSFGARSFAIWTTDGRQVFESGNEFERITARAVPDFFNSNHSESNFEGRSDDKGPEPENMAIGTVRGRTYAFIGLERIGGLMVYDITRPKQSEFVTYVNNRDFSVSMEDVIEEGVEDPADALDRAGDLGAEGVAFVPRKDSPTRTPLVLVANEVSGTTTAFTVDVRRGGR